MNRDRHILKALRKRDEQGARDLMREYGDRLLRSAYLLAGNETDARDLVQDTFVEAVRSIHRFREGSTLYTWLHGILINLQRNRRRKQKAWLWTHTFRTRDVAVEPRRPNETMDCETTPLARQVHALDPLSRQIVVLRFYEDMKLEDVARHLCLPLSTVKTRLRRAVARLQKNLEDSESF